MAKKSKLKDSNPKDSVETQEFWDKVRQDFIGKGKIQALRIESLENGRYNLHYKEGKRFEKLTAANKNELNRLLVEFGGKNPETVSAPDEFLELGEWYSNDLENLGHRVTQIKLSGLRMVRKTKIPISIPEGCGTRRIIRSKKSDVNGKSNMLLVLKDVEASEVSLSFNTQEEFDNMVDFIKGSETLSKLTWYVRQLNTYSIEAKKHCVWTRTYAGDGTKRMVMELSRLDSVPYCDCIKYDLLAAADGMIGSECQRVPDKLKEKKERLICEIHARNL